MATGSLVATEPGDIEKQQRLGAINLRLIQVWGKPEWHTPLPAVDELVCTILSQNTNDINRDKAFTALKNRYASWDEVRDADPAELMIVIRAAGLANQKGPNIQSSLRAIEARFGGITLDPLREMPPEAARAWLTGLKGVGLKTAAIVMVFSLDMPAFPVDTHIYRVSGRLGIRPMNYDVEKTHRYLESIGHAEDFGTLHLILIKLGREICQAHKPKCGVCPVNDLCEFPEKNLG